MESRRRRCYLFGGPGKDGRSAAKLVRKGSSEQEQKGGGGEEWDWGSIRASNLSTKCQGNYREKMSGSDNFHQKQLQVGCSGMHLSSQLPGKLRQKDPEPRSWRPALAAMWDPHLKTEKTTAARVTGNVVGVMWRQALFPSWVRSPSQFWLPHSSWVVGNICLTWAWAKYRSQCVHFL
jgi:hypothetical protein